MNTDDAHSPVAEARLHDHPMPAFSSNIQPRFGERPWDETTGREKQAAVEELLKNTRAQQIMHEKTKAGAEI